MGALSSFVTDHEITFGLYYDNPWIMMTSSQTAYFLRPVGS